MTNGAEESGPERVLEEGVTFWRCAEAARAAVLVDGAAYYAAVRAAMLEARESIQIMGWDLHRRTRLVGPDACAGDGGPEEFGPFLEWLVSRRPELRIGILLWDYSLIYAKERDPVPTAILDWTTPEQITIRLDSALPAMGSHHQKVVVIDGKLAFSGGLDITVRRWDTPSHSLDNEDRVDQFGNGYRPFHDIQIAVSGEAAGALADLVAERWRAAGYPAPGMEGGNDPADPWPDGLDPEFETIPVYISRTRGAHESVTEVREVEALFVRMIASAERTIYLENQFFTSQRLADALCDALSRSPALEAVLVGPNVHHSWLEERAMDTGRRRFMQRLGEAGVTDRVRLLYPALPGDTTGQGVMVHSKLSVIDDTLLRVGSANLNNRSMGLDTECDLTLEARTDAQRATVGDVRNRLLAEHLGTTSARVADAMEAAGSLIGAIERLNGSGRRLEPIDTGTAPMDPVARAVNDAADPDGAFEPAGLVEEFLGGREENGPGWNPGALAWQLVAPVVFLLGLAALWQFTPLSAYVDPTRLADLLDRAARTPWAPLAVPIGFVVAGGAMFPVTVLILVTAILFPPAEAFAYSLAGAMLSALASYAAGRALGAAPLENVLGAALRRARAAMARHGVLGVAAIRMVPVAPFTVVNFAAGAVRVELTPYVLGTLLGLVPGVAVLTFLGAQVSDLLADPSPGQILAVVAAGLAWIALGFALQRLARLLRSAEGDV